MSSWDISQIKKELKYFGRFVKIYTLKKYNIIEIFLLWCKRRLSRSQFLILSGIIVGFLGGIAGIILKTIVFYIRLYTIENRTVEERIFAYATLPIIAILLTTWVARYLYKSKKDIKLGDVLVDIAKNRSNINKQEIHSRLVQSAITVGLGGSAGLETPSAITGAAIGSNFGKRYHLDYKEKTLLLAGGAAAGIASAFNAPIAGVMFSFEILLTGVVFSDFIPLVISSLCGSLITNLVLNDEILFSFKTRPLYNIDNTPYYIILGIIAGFYSRYYILSSKKVSNFLERFPFGSFKRASLGGAILALCCVAFPALYGDGYVNIQMLHEGNINYVIYQHIIDLFGYPQLTILIMLILTLAFKSIATSASLNSGGVGGNFAPSLVAGGLLGYTFGYALIWIGFDHAPIFNLMLVGMAGVLSGVLYTPLTAIFLIAESSSGYDLMIPLMIVSVTSYLINKHFSPINPVYSKLADEGEIFTQHNDLNIVSQINLQECIDSEGIQIKKDAHVREVDNLFKNSDKAIMAVVDEQKHFWGMIRKEDIYKILDNERDYKGWTAADLAITPNHLVEPNEKMGSVVQKFEQADAWYLPVVDKQQVFHGLASRYRFLYRYRQLLKMLS